MTDEQMIHVVTGGAGFIGSHFVEHLLEKISDDERIIIVDKYGYASDIPFVKNLTNKNPKQCSLEIIDLCNQERVDHLFESLKNEKVKVWNFASESHVDNSIKDGRTFAANNVDLMLNLLEGARKVSNLDFIHISTDEVIGSINSSTGTTTDNMPHNPSSPYAASKAAQEDFLNAYKKTYGLNIGLVRLTNQFGPRQHSEKLIPTLVSHILNDQPCPIYTFPPRITSNQWIGGGDSFAVRNWGYVKYTVEELYNYGNSNMFRMMNITSSVSLNTLEIAQLIAKVLNKDLKLDILNSDTVRPAHDKGYHLDGINTMTYLQTTFMDDLTTTVKSLMKEIK